MNRIDPDHRGDAKTSWIMLGLVLLVQVVSPTGYYGLSALAPFMLDDWGINRKQFGMLLSAFSTGTFLFAFPAGIFTDRVGVLKVLFLGQVVTGIFVGLAPWLPWYGAVLAMMFVAGAGYGLLNPAGSKAVFSWFPPQRRAIALSIKQTSLPLCGMLSGLLLPPLSVRFGWRTSWMAAGLVTLVAAVLTTLLYKEAPSGGLPGAVKTLFPASAFGLLRQGVILRVSFLAFLLTGIQICWHGYITLFLKDYLGASAVRAGAHLALMQACAIVGRPAQGIVSDVLFKGSRRGVLMLVSMSCLFLGGFMALLPKTAPLWMVAAILVIIGFTAISWHGVHLTWMTEIAGPTTAGAASGLWIGSCHFAIILVGPIFGAIVDYSGAYAPGWLFTSLLSALAMGILFSMRDDQSDTDRAILTTRR